MKPVRLQLSRAAGFNLQAYSLALNGLPAVKCDRTSPFGNPWVVGQKIDMKQALRWGWQISPLGQDFVCQSSEDAVGKFEHALVWDEAIHTYVRTQLGGKNLACWCHMEAPCHCYPLLFVANSTKAAIREIHERTDEALIRRSREMLDRVNGDGS